MSSEATVNPATVAEPEPSKEDDWNAADVRSEEIPEIDGEDEDELDQGLQEIHQIVGGGDASLIDVIDLMFRRGDLVHNEKSAKKSKSKHPVGWKVHSEDSLDRTLMAEYVRAFKYLDKDKNSTLTFDEIADMLSIDMTEYVKEAVGEHHSLHAYKFAPMERDEYINTAKQIIKEVDFNHDGTVQMNEFLVFVGRKIPLESHKYLHIAIKKKFPDVKAGDETAEESSCMIS